ncbi:hypothetical protein SLA2020_364930 [Shorea laevis]
MIPPGKSLMAINGALISIDDIDLYLLVDLVHQDLLLAHQYSKLKIPHTIIRKLLSTLPPPESNMFRVDFRSTHVHFLNNLEEDAMYKRWRSNINEILMPVFPGQLRYIRKNLFHAVYVLDPGTICGLESIDMITSFFVKQIEINSDSSAKENDSQNEEDVSSLIIRLFIYIKENHGIKTAFHFLGNVNKLRIEADDSADDAPEMHHVEGAFVETVLPKVKSPPQDILLKLEREKTFKEESQESSMFVFKLGVAKLQCCLLMNGLVFDSNEESLINAMNDELPRIQNNRYNPQIIANGKPKFISLATSILGGESVLNDINYLHSPETMDDLKAVTHLLSVDAASKKGMKLLHEGLRYLIEGSKRARVGVLFSVNSDAHLSSLLFVKVFEITASSFSHKKNALDFLDKLCSFYEQKYIFVSPKAAENTQAFLDKVYELAEANGLPSKAFKSALSEFSIDQLRKHVNKVSKFVYRQLGHEFGVNAVITNGRVMFPIDESTFLSHDLHLLESVELKQRIKHTVEIIEEVSWQDMDPDVVTRTVFLFLQVPALHSLPLSSIVSFLLPIANI